MWTLIVDCCLNYPWFLPNLSCLNVNLFAHGPMVSPCLNVDNILLHIIEFSVAFHFGMALGVFMQSLFLMKP